MDEPCYFISPIDRFIILKRFKNLAERIKELWNISCFILKILWSRIVHFQSIEVSFLCWQSLTVQTHFSPIFSQIERKFTIINYSQSFPPIRCFFKYIWSFFTRLKLLPLIISKGRKKKMKKSMLVLLLFFIYPFSLNTAALIWTDIADYVSRRMHIQSN